MNILGWGSHRLSHFCLAHRITHFGCHRAGIKRVCVCVCVCVGAGGDKGMSDVQKRCLGLSFETRHRGRKSIWHLWVSKFGHFSKPEPLQCLLHAWLCAGCWGRWERLKKKKISWDFLGGPVVRTLPFHCRGQRVQSLGGELRFYMLHGSTKKKKRSVSERVMAQCGGEETYTQMVCNGMWKP